MLGCLDIEPLPVRFISSTESPTIIAGVRWDVARLFERKGMWAATAPGASSGLSRPILRTLLMAADPQFLTAQRLGPSSTNTSNR